MREEVFITGGTGYLGRPLTERLLEAGHRVRVLARPGSESKAAPGCKVVIGDALRPASFAREIGSGCTLVHLVGTPHPAPWKEREFREVDLVALQASVDAAVERGVAHFVFLSVAQPAPVMRAYQAVRAECERMVRAAGLRATFARPWYVLGEGHWWPLALRPLYRLAERFPSTREAAYRLGLVTLEEMIDALVWAVEHPPQDGARILSVPSIRACAARGRKAPVRV